MALLNEDTLVQQTTADYLETQLGWDSVVAYHNETFGAESLLGRQSDKEVVLTRYLGEALVKLNPGLPGAAYQDALRQMVDAPVMQNTLQINREHYERVKSGVPVQYRNSKGELEKKRLKVFDFEEPENNHFLCVRELWVRGDIYRRRADIVGFVNGLPLLFVECKTLHKDIRHAFEKNLCDYKDTVPHLFHHNALIILANGVDAKIGSVSSRFEHFNDWKRLVEDEPGVVDMETLLKGVCNKRNFIDLFENFIVFDESREKMVKIVARNHQYLGVNRAIDAVKHRKERNGRLGVFWHTQGSGKSYSMVFFTRKIHRCLGSHFTFLICTDRDDLDGQIYKTYAGCGLVDNDRDPCRAGSGEHLKELLNQHKAYVFTLVQKFNQDVHPDDPYSDRDDVIVITDEAHRTQYGRLSLNLRNALPNAGYIGFTGTPLFKDDEITRRVFGDYISTYDFQRAVEDNATVPLYYDARGEKLGIATSELNERIAEKLEEIEIDDIDTAARLEQELKRDYHLITAEYRLRQIAEDFVTHYSTQWETGKAMLVCIDKVTCVRMHGLILACWDKRIAALEQQLNTVDEQAAANLSRQIDWMRGTRMAVVVSEEQGEVDKFRKWDLDITPHRRLIKEGFETGDGKRIDIETAFKKENHPFRVAIVCAMWLTGFDVPSLSTLYLDKPLKAHTLMQAIARANRVHEGKNNGLIVDYCGILKNLRKALATFAGHQGAGMTDGDDIPPEIDPVRPEAELLADLEEAIESVRAFLQAQDFRLEDVLEKTGFDRNKAIVDAKEAVNQNDEARKRFEIICREVFRKFRACLTIKDINQYRHAYDAINIIYKKLQEGVEKADISDIIRALHRIIEENIEPVTSDKEPGIREERALYDISRINFERLKKEFERARAKHTIVHDLKTVIENKLFKMMQQNPTRTNFQKHYEEIIEAYNREKNRATIEQTFEDMMRFAENLDEEDRRAAREGLDEESLAVFDLLFKPDLSRQETDRLKQVATGLYQTLQAQLAQIQDFSAKQSTRDEIRIFIKNYLWDDRTGLPASFQNNEIEEKADVVFAHVLMHEKNSRRPFEAYR
ncbi:type I restriction enzyme, R subunit [Nitrosomonas marina]|uniref:Type I restriction enzyme endonuclease subunit n=1 Tax=Nitrosomonas marina TaxID=917 RepID=A0A1I0FLF8_9PROT|nr:type I restriction endonuclease subunit R [Nitrosomonas marina]SET59049.1 type I restriction enzyme, R subunit [Nitrosomonas marina]